MPLRVWNLQNLFIMHTNKKLIKIVHVEITVIRAQNFANCSKRGIIFLQ